MGQSQRILEPGSRNRANRQIRGFLSLWIKIAFNSTENASQFLKSQQISCSFSSHFKKLQNKISFLEFQSCRFKNITNFWTFLVDFRSKSSRVGSQVCIAREEEEHVIWDCNFCDLRLQPFEFAITNDLTSLVGSRNHASLARLESHQQFLGTGLAGRKTWFIPFWKLLYIYIYKHI